DACSQFVIGELVKSNKQTFSGELIEEAVLKFAAEKKLSDEETAILKEKMADLSPQWDRYGAIVGEIDQVEFLRQWCKGEISYSTSLFPTANDMQIFCDAVIGNLAFHGINANGVNVSATNRLKERLQACEAEIQKEADNRKAEEEAKA